MANTVTLLNYANTFGDWVVTTNALAIENNNLAANNYTKATGTLFLNAPSTGLQVANNATIQGQLSVSGVGSSAIIQNNLTVSQGTIFAANSTGLGLRVDGVANIASLNIVGTGNALQVANNANISGIIRVEGAAGLSSTLTVSESVKADSVTANAYTQTPLSYATVIYSDLMHANTGIESQFISASDSIYSNYLYSNTAMQTGTLVSTGTANVASITANSHVNTSSLYVSTIANVEALYSNTSISGPTGSFRDLTVSGDFIINGSTIYDSDRFNLKGGSPITGTDTATFGVNRQSGLSTFTPNAQIQFSNATRAWALRDVGGADANLYFNIVTEKYTANVTNAGIVQLSNSNTSSSITQALSLAGANTLSRFVENTYGHANAGYSIANAAYSRANTSANSFVGTTGSIAPVAGVVNYSSNNGVVISGQGNTLYVNTPQDLRTSGTPTFGGLTLTAALPITQGGTGATNAADARTSILPTGTTAGYVLTTGGPGTFYWAAASSGGSGVTPGTSINSTRLSYTGNGTTQLYTTPSYIPGASQLRIYIDGVRQFASEYTETSNTSVTFGTAPASGSNILVEVDGYYVTPNYANNITFTAPFGGIVSSANTIQLAIQDVETRKAALTGGTFTGVVQGPTVDTNASNTAFATTAFIKNVLASGNTFNINAATVTNGVYTNGSYTNPTWISALAGSKISGTVSSANNITDYTINQSVGSSNSVQFNSIGVGVSATGTAGEIRATNNITAYYSSDKKFKDKVENIQNALGIVDAIGGKTFEWTDEYIQANGGEDEYFMRKNDFGVIAQDVQSVFPLAVRTRADGSLAVDYEKMCAIAFQAIKELKAEVDALKGNNK